MYRLLLAAQLLLLLASTLHAQGKIAQARSEVAGEEEKPAKSAACGEEDSFLGEILGNLLSGCVEILFQRPEESRCKCGFLPYPYAHGYPGYCWLTPADPTPPPGELEVGGCAGRAFLDAGHDFDGLTRLGGQLFVEASSGWGVRLDGGWFHERLPAGRNDDTFLGTAFLTYRFIERPRFECYLGGGVPLLSDPSLTRAGFAVTAGFDAYPAKPLVLSALADLGTLGSATYGRARATAGILAGPCEVFAGYDVQRVGSASLHGPLVGLRFWF